MTKTSKSDDGRHVEIMRIMEKRGRGASERARIDALSDEDFLREVRGRVVRSDAAEAAARERERGGKRRYQHTACWYAKQAAKERERERQRWRESRRGPRRTFTEAFLETAQESYQYWQRSRDSGSETLFCHPLVVLAGVPVCLAADIGYAMFDTARAVADPVERERMLRELRRDLRALRRPAYYRQETERRRRLARERRQVVRRATLAAEPTPAQVLEAWERRRESKERMILLGGMLQDLECFVDNSLRFDADGNVAGRNAGIKGWIDVHLPQLSGKYKTLMRYKAMAVRLRQATETRDPTPTDAVLSPAHPRHEVVKGLLEDLRTSFAFLDGELKRLLDPEAVFLDAAPAPPGRGRPEAAGKRAKTGDAGDGERRSDASRKEPKSEPDGSGGKSKEASAKASASRRRGKGKKG